MPKPDERELDPPPESPTVQDQPDHEPQVRFSIARIRDADEFRSIPGMVVAAAFAEATNTLSTARFGDYLHPDVEYRSGWGRVQCRGKEELLAWLNNRFALARRLGGYRSQIVVLPDGTAGVLTGCLDDTPPALTRFELKSGLARRIDVTDQFDRDALRETLYAPPEA